MRLIKRKYLEYVTSGRLWGRFSPVDGTLEEISIGSGLILDPVTGEMTVKVNNDNIAEDAAIATSKLADGGLFELNSNKVTALSSESTNEQYPGAKFLFDELSIKSNTSHKHYMLHKPDGSTSPVYVDAAGLLHIDNGVVQSGEAYETHAEKIYTKNDYIILRDGATAGLANGDYVGFLAKLYDGINDGCLVYDNAGIARVGDVGSEQPICTRIENPTNGHIPFWDMANKRLNFKALELSDLPVDNSVRVRFDFQVIEATVYNCPAAMRFTTQTSEGTAATLSIALNTDLAQFTKLTITPTAIGLVILTGITI